MAIKLRRGMFETELPDMEAVREAASSGKAGPDDEIWDPLGESWRPIREVLAASASPSAAGPLVSASDATRAKTAGERDAGPSSRKAWLWLGGACAIIVLGLLALLLVSQHGRCGRAPSGDEATVRSVMLTGEAPAGDEATAKGVVQPGEASVGGVQPDAAGVSPVGAPACGRLALVGSPVTVKDDGDGVESPAMVWVGSEYLVLWGSTKDNRVAGPMPVAWLVSQRLSADGRPVGPAVKVHEVRGLPDGAASVSYVAAANGRGGITVAYGVTGDAFSGTMFARLAPDSGLIGQPATVVDNELGGLGLTAADESFGLAYLHYSDTYPDGAVFLARIGSDGSLTRPGDGLAPASGLRAAIASVVWNGESYALAWTSEADSPSAARGSCTEAPSQAHLARVGRDGAVLGTAPLVEDASGCGPEWLSLVWADGEYGLLWSEVVGEWWTLHFSRLAADGTKVGDVALMPNEDVNQGVLTWTGAQYFAAWEDGRDGEIALYVAQLDRTGSRVQPDVRVTSGEDVQVDMAWNGTGLGLVWTEGPAVVGGNIRLRFAGMECR